MEYRPDKETLIAYLYGELPPAEMERVRMWLETNPEEKNRLEGFQDIRQLLGKLEDKEPQQPFVIYNAPSIPNSRFWQGGLMKVAATITILVAAVFILQPTITKDPNGIAIRFGGKTAGLPSPAIEGPDERAYENLLTGYAKQSDSVLAALAALDSKYDNVEQKINSYLQTKSSDKDGAALRKLINEIQLENTRNLISLLDQNNRQQEENLQRMFTGFYNHYENQRAQDLRNINLAINDMQVDNYERLSQTDRLLAQLVNNK